MTKGVLLCTFSHPISLVDYNKRQIIHSALHTNALDGCPVAACCQKHALYTTVLAHITKYGVHFRLLPIFTSKPETVREFDWMQMAGSSTQMTVAKFNRKTWEEPHKHTSHILFPK